MLSGSCKRHEPERGRKCLRTSGVQANRLTQYDLCLHKSGRVYRLRNYWSNVGL